MRLLKAQSNGSFSLVDFQGKELPPYAILSHTWGARGEEVTYKDLQNAIRQEKIGYTKLDFCKEQAAKDDLHYFWIDTCCIDKSSSAELSEAINSMFNWYRKASKCYVYLSDVTSTNSAQNGIEFSRSRWFTRGWTLQELLAPHCVQFFSKEGDLIGDKHSRAEEISKVTNIPIEALQEPNLCRFSVEQRMRWAEKRETTREEDRVYSLLGIFNVYMPSIYGEGEDHARQRMKRLLRESEENKTQKLNSIQHWLSAPDPSVNYQKALKQRQHDTGLWFLKGERYESWKLGDTSFLWLHGIPGCGKTILSSTILENISQHCNDYPGYAIAYFYFDFNDVQKQDSDRMLRSVLVQLSKQVDDIPPSLDALFSSHGNGNRPPTLNEVLKTLCDIIRHYSHVFIVLDALDECNQRPELMEVLEEMASWNISNLHFLMTSRQEQDIKSCFEGFVSPKNSICLQRDAVDKDIQLYVRQRLCNDRNLIKWRNDATLQQEIEDTLAKGSKGMFRWATCQLDTLAKCLNRSLLRKALKTLPSTLDETYERILNKINDEHAEYAIRILQWLAFSERPLSMQEIAEVIAIDVSRDPEFDPEEILEDPLDALKICSSLVTVTKTRFRSQTREHIVLAHYSVKEFLVSGRIQLGPAARYGLQAAACHKNLAMACLGYLNQFQETDVITEESSEDFKLARYSAQFWHTHARKTGDGTTDVDRLAVRLLSTSNPAYLNWIRIYDPAPRLRMLKRASSRDKPPNPLYYASLFGLEKVASLLLDKGADVNAFGGPHHNALRAAMENGHERTVRILLEAGANVGLDRQSKGALHHAVNMPNCTTSLVSMLLEFGAPISTTDDNNMTPLHYCVKHNHSTIAAQLIDVNVSIDIRVHRNGPKTRTRAQRVFHDPVPTAPGGIETGLTPLHFAVLAGNVEMTKLLLEYGADPNALSEHRETPPYLAFKKLLSGPQYDDDWSRPLFLGHLDTDSVRPTNPVIVLAALLEDPRTSLNTRNYLGKTLLHYMLYGNPDSATWVRRLVSRGADPSCGDASQQTPLHFAIRAGDYESVKVLIDLGAEAEQQDYQGLNALHYAAQKGNHKTIVAILEADEANRTRMLAAKDSGGKNVLHHLLGGGVGVNVQTVDLLLRQGADSLAVDNSGKTPLAILACRTPYATDEYIWRALLRVNGNASYSNSKGKNLGHLYVDKRVCSFHVILLMHSHGVNLAKKDCEGQTILHVATRQGSLTEDMLTYLVEKVGLRVAEKDIHGRNALQYVTKRAFGRSRLPRSGLSRYEPYSHDKYDVELLFPFDEKLLPSLRKFMASQNEKTTTKTNRPPLTEPN